MPSTPDLGIPELSQGQANPDITFNEALVIVEALQKGVKDRDLSAPPVSPTEGDSYIVKATGTGAWAGRSNCIAIYWGGSWRFVPGNNDAGTPISMGARQEGLRVWLQDENAFVIWTGSPLAWTAATFITDGDKGDIVVSSSGNVWSLDPSANVSEIVQDAVGAALANSTRVTLTYNDGVPSITADLVADTITVGYMHAAATQRLFGRNTASAGAGEEVTVSQVLDWAGATNGYVLYRTGGAWTANTPDTAGLVDKASTQTISGAKTLTAALNISGAFTGLTNTDSPFVLTGSDAGASGPTMVSYHNSASPAAADVLARWRIYGKDSAANDTLYGSISLVLDDPVDTTEDAHFTFSTIGAGANAARLAIGLGLYHPSAGGGDKGNNTLNFSTIYQNNVQVLNSVSPTASGAATFNQASSSTDVFRVVSTDAGVVGVVFQSRHNSASPAANDVPFNWRSDFQDDGGTQRVGGNFNLRLVDPVSATRTVEWEWQTTVSAVGPSIRASLRAGLYMAGATGGDQGAGTINATALYDDAVFIVCMPLHPEMSQADWDALVPDRIIPPVTETVAVESGKFTEPEFETRTRPTGRILPAIIEKRQRPTGRVIPAVYEDRPVKGKKRQYERVLVSDEVQELETYDHVVRPERPEMERYQHCIKEAEPIMTTVAVEVVPAQRIKREHRTARRHFDMLASGFKPGCALSFVDRMKADGALPGLATIDEYKQRVAAGDKFSKAEVEERHALAMDYMGQAFADLVARVKDLEAQLAARNP